MTIADELLDAVLADEAITVATLLNRGASPNTRHRTGLSVLATARSGEVVRLLVEAGAEMTSVDRQSGTALHYLYDGRTGKAEVLIEAGGDLYTADASGLTPLERLTSSGHYAIARALLHRQERRGLRPTPRGEVFNHALNNATVARDFERDRHRWRLGDRFWASPFTALELGDNALLRQLIDEGVPLDVRSDSDATPAICAVTTARVELAALEMLIAAGAALDARDSGGRSALDWAVRLARPEFARLLPGVVPARQTDAFERGVHAVLLGQRGSASAALYPGEELPVSIGEDDPRDPTGTTLRYTDAIGRVGVPLLERAGAAWCLPLIMRLARGDHVRLREFEEAKPGLALRRYR